MPSQPPASPSAPLRTYQFRVAVLPPHSSPGAAAQRYVAGLKRVSGLNVSISATETREGGNALHRYANPDRASWDPIALDQGLAVDDTLERWARAVLAFLTDGSVDATEPVKRNVVIDVWDPGLHGPDLDRGLDAPAQRVRRYLIVNAWISKLRALPQLDAMADETGLLSVEFTHEGWHVETPAAAASPLIA